MSLHLRGHGQAVGSEAGAGRDVAMTIIGGEVVYEQGRCTKVDDEGILDEARIRARELV